MKEEKNIAPPKWSLRFLSWFCPGQLYEEIEGDLLQRFERDLRPPDRFEKSDDYWLRRARRRFIWNAIRFLRPGIVLRRKFSTSLNTTIMLRNYFVVATRNFLKRKALNSINIAGISVGISLALLAVLFISDEFSFDDFHKNKNLIYRADIVMVTNGSLAVKGRSIALPIPALPALKESVGEIEYATRYNESNAYVLAGKNQFRETIHYVDRDVLKMFTIHFTQGNAEVSLQNVTDIAISASKAVKLFGAAPVIGKTIEIEKQLYVVSGVFDDFPHNSSFDPKFLIRYENYFPYKVQSEDWNASYSPVFVQLRSSANVEALRGLLQKFSDEHLNPFTSVDWKRHLELTSLDKVHFDSEIPWLNVSNTKYSYILSGIAVAVLLVACINYILLSLAGSLSRSREIGVRKVMGATRRMIRLQFFGESLILVCISVCVSVILISLMLPQFNNFMGRHLSLFQWTGSVWIVALFGIILITGFIAGGYPALILSRLIPQAVLKSNSKGNYKTGFSFYLVLIQFSTCFVLLICTLVMLSQMKMVQSKDLGFNHNQVVVIEMANDVGVTGRTILSNFRSELVNEPDIAAISAIGANFGSVSGSSSRTDSTGKVLTMHNTNVEFDFFEILEMKLVEGRFFSRDHPSDTLNPFVINESLALQESSARRITSRALIGEKLNGREIIGIVKDFNFQSLNHEVKPWAFSYRRDYWNQMLVKIQSDNIPQTIAKLENTWNKVVGSGHLQFSFLDDHINKQYERYTQWIRIISISAFLAIAITGLGLLGIISLAVINRTKEIGIRKVLGASINSIVVLFSNRYAMLVVFAFIIAIPIADHFSTLWLQDFAYKTDVGFAHYVIPLLAVGIFTLAIIASQVVRAAKANPVDSIHYE